MKLTIDLDALPSKHRDTLLLTIKKYAMDELWIIEGDIAEYSDGDAKKDMKKWSEALRKISDDATNIYKEYNFSTFSSPRSN